MLKASGEGLHAYLQGQLTQDMDLLDDAQGIYACALTPQGKPVADLYLMAGHGGEMVMWCESDYAVALVARLRRFALGHTLRIGIVQALAVLAVQGPETDRALVVAGLPVPGRQRYATASLDKAELFAMRMPAAASDGVWLALDQSDIQQWLQGLGNVIADADMEAGRIMQGTPRFGVDWDERELPLNANLIERGGVSFDKGCYVGQEVTSRMHWRDGRRRRLYRLQLQQSPAELPADVYRRELNIGRLTSAAVDASGASLGIASLPLQVEASGLTTGHDKPVQILGVCGED